LPVFFDLNAYTVAEASVIWPETTWGSGSWVRCKGDVAVGILQHSADQVAFDPQTRGFAIAWSTCQSGYSVAPGYCWLPAITSARICPASNPATGDMGVVDCASRYAHPIVTFCAGVMGPEGDSPCQYTTVQPTTWGSIKAMFK
jgi:hypothetical protein